METVAIPILMKAVDFLFEEATKILKERRERRMAGLESQEADSATKAKKKKAVVQSAESAGHITSSDTHMVDIIQSRDAALSTSVDESAWKDTQAEVKHLLSMLEVYTTNYHLAKEQYAKFGSALVPSIIVHNLEEAEDGIADVTEKLKAILSKVYGKQVVIPRSEQV